MDKYNQNYFRQRFYFYMNIQSILPQIMNCTYMVALAMSSMNLPLTRAGTLSPTSTNPAAFADDVLVL